MYILGTFIDDMTKAIKKKFTLKFNDTGVGRQRLDKKRFKFWLNVYPTLILICTPFLSKSYKNI